MGSNVRMFALVKSEAAESNGPKRMRERDRI